MKKKAGIGTRIQNWRRAYFPDRQIFLRSDGHVRYVTISGPVQEILAASAVALSIWGMIASYGFFTRDQLVAEHVAEINNLENVNALLTSGFETLEEQLLRRAHALEQRQEFLDQVLNQDELGIAPGTDGVSESEAPVGGEVEAAKTTAVDLNFLDFWGSGKDESPLSVEERNVIIADRFNTILAHQKATAEKLHAKKTRELAELDQLLADTKLTVEGLATQFGADTIAAAGGPFEPLFSGAAGDPAWMDGPFIALFDSIENWNAPNWRSRACLRGNLRNAIISAAALARALIRYGAYAPVIPVWTWQAGPVQLYLQVHQEQ